MNNVEQVLNRKLYKGRLYYKLKWRGSNEPTWEWIDNCDSIKHLIQDYERQIELHSKDEDENEWEVEEILKKRVRKGQVEYLVKWKNWPGDPSWVKEKNCDCINLIAAFENPKLKKMWNFDGSNQKLWLDSNSILKYMKKYAKKFEYTVNLLTFADDYPANEEPPKLVEGLNIGPLCYKRHWYLVIILVNHICITRQVLVGDPLNTLIGVQNTRVHPVFKRLVDIFPKIPVRPMTMTQMDRSDLCAFYVLASYERALKLLKARAKFVPSKLFFDPSRSELIRSKIRPDTDGQFSVALPVNGALLDGPRCEFCDKLFDTFALVNDHITRRHMNR